MEDSSKEALMEEAPPRYTESPRLPCIPHELKSLLLMVALVVVALVVVNITFLLLGLHLSESHAETVLWMSIQGLDGEGSPQQLAVSRGDRSGTFAVRDGHNGSAAVVYDYSKLLVGYRSWCHRACYITRVDKDNFPGLDAVTETFQRRQDEDKAGDKAVPLADRSILGTTINILCSAVPVFWEIFHVLFAPCHIKQLQVPELAQGREPAATLGTGTAGCSTLEVRPGWEWEEEEKEEEEEEAAAMESSMKQVVLEEEDSGNGCCCPGCCLPCASCCAKCCTKCSWCCTKCCARCGWCCAKCCCLPKCCECPKCPKCPKCPGCASCSGCLRKSLCFVPRLLCYLPRKLLSCGRLRCLLIAALVLVLLVVIVAGALLMWLSVEQRRSDSVLRASLWGDDENAATFYLDSGDGNAATVIYDYRNLLVSYRARLHGACYVTRVDQDNIPGLDSVVETFQRRQAEDKISVPLADRSMLGTTAGILCSLLPVYWA
ncbi:pulmonary surfactant-associated protein C [Melozone crissalis]|uniref:pulmonary surfactant-associated protein C n=1 Tax=Melozone crissalis TaxID=40204 RepID=UPI0023DACCC2|nr:pulmonary surfactant-associated protein C [Melozone crissalis]